MSIRDRKDFWSGVMFLVVGALFLFWSRSYTIGTTRHMGPGYFPMVLAILMIVLGALIIFGSMRAHAEETHVEPIGWRGLIIVLVAVAAFGIFLDSLGFVVSLVILLIGSSLATKEFRLVEALISTVVLGIASYYVFVYGLGLQFPVWPTFIGQ